MTDVKPCKVCDWSRRRCHGVAASSLDQLKIKGREKLGFDVGTPVLVTLEDDGTIVEDEDYFLCLPSNTKFILLRHGEMWKPDSRCDERTAWPSHDSGAVETDVVDSAEAWPGLAHQLKQDLASIIFMSEADLQSLVDVPCADLATALGFPEKKAHDLQDTLQRVLDRREEERQSRDLLQLYLKAVEKESSQAVLPDGKKAEDEVDGVEMDSVEMDSVEMDSVVAISSRTLQVLKTKTRPETRLSNKELQLVLDEGVVAMAETLGWDRERTGVLIHACGAELERRVQQVQSLQALCAHAKNEATPPKRAQKRAKRS
ncbi:DNA fragmentation factor subunit alpha [Brachyhypopomus gauderio]|uniref:DNA fragmentation factor subunit alpha n=1 Tax=Brachyhypopomus gauderio TaxID=698409 RepID=UPI004042CD8A